MGVEAGEAAAAAEEDTTAIEDAVGPDVDQSVLAEADAVGGDGEPVGMRKGLEDEKWELCRGETELHGG